MNKTNSKNNPTPTKSVNNELILTSDDKVRLVEKMRYQSNTFGYWISLLALSCTIVYVFMILNIVKPDPMVAVKIMMNIILFFVTFLGMEKVKNYSVKWSITMIVLGGIALLRILWMPLQVIRDGGEFGKVSAGKGTLLIGLLVAGAGLYVLSGVVSFIKSVALRAYLKSIEEKR